LNRAKLWRNVCTARYWKKQDSISKTWNISAASRGLIPAESW
jgi:nudix_YtkD: nucleoside triphosphatase YtkD